MQNISLDLLVPHLSYINGQFVYIDDATGDVISDTVMEEYNKQFGYHGYDEYNDDAGYIEEFGDCGDA